MNAKRFSPLLLGSSLAASSTFAFALGLGDAAPKSALGEPLVLNIPVSIGPGEEVGEHCFQLRPAPFNMSSGLPSISQGSVAVLRAGGNTVLRVSTTAPVDEPLIAIGIETRCQINVSRDYSVFLSPREDADPPPVLAASPVWDVPAASVQAAPADEAAVIPTLAAVSEPAPAAPVVTAAPSVPVPRTEAPVVAAARERTAVVVPPSASKSTSNPANMPANQPIMKPAAPQATLASAPVPRTSPAPVSASRSAPVARMSPAPASAAARAPAPTVKSRAPAPRDSELVALTAAVEALRAQIAAQEQRLQELTARQPAPVRVAGQPYRAANVIPASFDFPISRNEPQTIYRATPVTIQQAQGVSLEAVGLALLLTALIAGGGGHYLGRRTPPAAGNATRSRRRPTRRARD